MAELNTDSGTELLNRLMMILMRYGVDPDTARSEVYVVLHDYTVTPRQEALVVYEGDKNERFFKEFVMAKVVKGCTKKTCTMYYNTLRCAFARIGKSADTVTPDDLRFYTALRLGEVSKTSCNNEQHVLSSFYSWMTNNDRIRVNPMTKIDMVKVPKVQRKAFTGEEVELMRMHLRTNREKAVFEILMSTGCRISELTQMRIEQLQPDGSVQIIGKGEKMRTVYMNAKARLVTQQYLAERKDKNPYLLPKSTSILGNGPMRKVRENWYKYPSLVHPDDPQDNSGIENMMRGLGKRSGVKDVHPHRFRRTCATFALQKGMPIALVSRMLGHESISTTQIYLDLSDDDLMSAHRKYVT